ncbi:MAG: YCF48-related protein [Bacteroidota bacterium]|nr:YCF48-related protein [Bacteroidota bacterium]
MKKIFLMMMIIIGTTATYSQWVWQSPKPTGNDIRDVHFIAGTDIGWFVGYNGTIFKTTDAGKKWLEQSIEPQYDFTSVFALDPNHVWIATGGFEDGSVTYNYFKIFFSSDGGSQWIEQMDGVELTSDTLNLRRCSIWSLSFIDDMIGWAVGDSGLILKTTDGGNNWNLYDRVFNYSLEKVQFIDGTLGFISGGILAPSHPPTTLSISKGIILRTTDSGTQWDTLYSDTLDIHNAYFRSATLGWALGTSMWVDIWGEGNYRNFLLKTSDGGISWQKSFWGTYSPKEGIFFSSDLNGWVVGPWGSLMTTTDGGKFWSYSNPTQRFVNRLRAIYFSDPMHGYIVGSDGAILQSTDSGQSWSHYDQKLFGGVIDDIFFVNSDTGWFVQSDLYRTTDGGESWNPSGLSGLRRIYCYDRSHCWACGYNGKIVFSSDAGITWTEQNSGVTDWLTAIKFVNTQIGWTGGGGTTILKTTNGGSIWFTQTTLGTGLDRIFTLDSNNVWLLGTHGVAHTTDGGLTWLPNKLGQPSPLFFLNRDTGWAATRDSIYRTFDGGYTWEALGRRPISVYTVFADVNFGWSRQTSIVHRTTNSGASWESELQTDVYHMLWSIHFVDSSHGWVAGNGGTLIRYGYPEKTTSVDENSSENISKYQLFQNYPNPFNSTTNIKYEIQNKSHVILKIYDILGKEVRTLINNINQPGNYTVTWDGKNYNGLDMPSGVYFYVLTYDKLNSNEDKYLFRQVKKLLFIK